MHPSSARLHRADGSPVGVYSGVGTFCSEQVVAAGAAIAIDARTPPAVAALIGCAASTGIGAVRNTAGVGRGESVVILGLGGVGLAALLAAVEAGAAPIIAVDIEAPKRELALTLGATHALDPGAASELASTLPAGGVDHALECSGRPQSAELILRLVRRGGTATLVGMPEMGATAAVDVYRFVEEGKRLLGSNYGSCVPARDFPRTAADVVSGRLPLAMTVSQTLSLAEIEDAFSAMRRRDGARRVVRFGQ
jgi:S-(hydroxymethyl)glutathione dehydrogenase/alcohol dehydrogenase